MRRWGGYASSWRLGKYTGPRPPRSRLRNNARSCRRVVVQEFEMLSGDILIGAQRVAGKERSFRAVNPATGEKLEPAFAFAGREDIDRACQLAWEAFHVYRETSIEERAKFLECIADKIIEIGDTLIDRACAETGLPSTRIEGERARTV